MPERKACSDTILDFGLLRRLRGGVADLKRKQEAKATNIGASVGF